MPISNNLLHSKPCIPFYDHPSRTSSFVGFSLAKSTIEWYYLARSILPSVWPLHPKSELIQRPLWLAKLPQSRQRSHRWPLLYTSPLIGEKCISPNINLFITETCYQNHLSTVENLSLTSHCAYAHQPHPCPAHRHWQPGPPVPAPALCTPSLQEAMLPSTAKSSFSLHQANT